MIRKTLPFLLLVGLSSTACAQKKSELAPKTKEQKLPAPPETWQEHWFEHNQLVKRVYYNDEVAMYYDDDMPRDIYCCVFCPVSSCSTFRG